MSEQRQLKTILFADIVGYTAMMQEDEQQALALLNDCKSILEREVAQHHGELVQYFGDGALLSFTSAQEGVSCSLDMQQAFVQDHIPARIGLHLGEVIKRNDNLFGDGVNLASRIESIAEPGSVLLSKALRDQVKNQSVFDLQSLGAFHFKNVTEPIEVFALANQGLTLPDRKKMSGKLAKKTGSRRWLWPVLGVLMVVGLVGAWAKFNPDENEPQSSINSPIDERIQDKRVTVMVFDNETADPSYDAFGKMISDWVTNGLMSIGSAQVINAANIKEQIQRLETDTTPRMNGEDELGGGCSGKRSILPVG
ncbi:MAG: adenylate/guanylate cyclase domain-containing protein [Bacteroidota bacterium]